MKRIGCLTFHGSHNYGSCLQAYALQQTFLKLGNGDVDYRIINYRTAPQKELYKSIFNKNDAKSLYSRLFLPFYRKQLEDKTSKFEAFIDGELKTTQEISSVDQFARLSKEFHGVVVGSDQVWNINARDFDDIYFLPNLQQSIKRMSYAVSMGVKPIDISEDKAAWIKDCLSRYDSVSVRDVETADTMNKMCNDREISIDCDPTLLLSKYEWEKLIADTSKITLPQSRYILFYDLSRNKENWVIAKRISAMMKAPLLITSVPFPRVIHMCISARIVKRFDVGPKEWLYLLKNSECVLSTSFHGTVFSSIFHKQFFTINCENDQRISHYLESIGLLNRNLTNITYKSCLDTPAIDFREVDMRIESMKEKSSLYISKWIGTFAQDGNL